MAPLAPRDRQILARQTTFSSISTTVVLGRKRLAEITPFDLERYRRQRKQAGVSDVSINRELAFLRNLYTMAITWGKASENPVTKIRFARENNGRTRFLTLDEEARLLACCVPSIKPIVMTALHTGFRMSELLSLTWADVDFRRRVVTVRAGYAKNGESRSIPMNSVLLETLCAMQGDAGAAGPVFCTSKGTPHKKFRTTFMRAVRKAGIDDLTFHDLRHCFASRLVMAGVDLPTVQALMGHKNITMTMRYTHLSADHKQRAVAMLEHFAEKVPAIFPTGRLASAGTPL